VLDRNGDKLRALLNRNNGIERTAAYLRHKLAIGYDYIVIDEITSAPDWADGKRAQSQAAQADDALASAHRDPVHLRSI